ncbi:uncharacterized protein [Leptinotarsa decemlineata]|uniref:uncharacterized protein n=1 Tax=Leptinotarsa decemlineata TaxID=7539 RepID=UPI003D306D92
MERIRKDKLPFNLFGITLEELYNEIEGPDTIVDEDVEHIPSDCEFEIDTFDDEDLADNVPVAIDNDGSFESDGFESDLPLSTMREIIVNTNLVHIPAPNVAVPYTPPTGPNTCKPTPTPDFESSSGVADFVQNNSENVTPFHSICPIIPKDNSPKRMKFFLLDGLVVPYMYHPISQKQSVQFWKKVTFMFVTHTLLFNINFIKMYE